MISQAGRLSMEGATELTPIMIAKEPPIGVRFPKDVKAALEKMAKADDRSLSYVINKIVADYLKARKLIK
jgi:hypothetical protein